MEWMLPRYPGIPRILTTRRSGGRMHRLPLLVLLLVTTLSLSGCDLVGDVLEFGFWALLIGFVLVVALVVWIFKKIF
jgi:hypothetical protein